jgi:hypothetical protein
LIVPLQTTNKIRVTDGDREQFSPSSPKLDTQHLKLVFVGHIQSNLRPVVYIVYMAPTTWSMDTTESRILQFSS